MLSIIVPVYNIKAQLPQCVDNILSQDGDFELLLVDDGSTDGSGLLCDAFSSDPRVRVIHTANQGVSCARNTGLQAAAGDWIWFVDGDDWIDPDAIPRLIAASSRVDIVLLGASNIYQGVDGRFSRAPRVQWPALSGPTKATERDIIYASNALWNKVIRRECIGEERFRTDLAFREDAEFYHRIVHSIYSAVILPESLYNYRVSRDGSASMRHVDELIPDQLKSAMLSYDSLQRIGWEMRGIQCILSEVQIIFSRLDPEDRAFYRHCFQQCQRVAAYPNRSVRLRYLLRGEASLRERLWYASLLFNPFHRPFMWRRKKKKLRRHALPSVDP